MAVRRRRFNLSLTLIQLILTIALVTDSCYGASIMDFSKAKRRAAFATSTVIHSTEHQTAQGVVKSSVFSQFATHPIHALLFQQPQPNAQQTGPVQVLQQQQQEPQAGIVVPTPAAPAAPATPATPNLPPTPAPSGVSSAHPAYLPPWTTSDTDSSGGQVFLVQGPFNVLVPPALPPVTSVAGAYLPPSAPAPAYLPPIDQAPAPEPAPAYLPPTPKYSPPPAPAYLAPPKPVTRVIQNTQAPKPEPPKKDARPATASVFAVPPPLADLKDWRAPNRKQSRSASAAGSAHLLQAASSSQVFNVDGAPNELTAQLPAAAFKSSEVQDQLLEDIQEPAIPSNRNAQPEGAATEAPPTALFANSVGLEQRLAAIRALRDSPPGGATAVDVLDPTFPVQYFQAG